MPPVFPHTPPLAVMEKRYIKLVTSLNNTIALYPHGLTSLFFDMERITEFPHPSLGVVRGWTSPSTRQFLGIRYATLTGKWAPPDPKGIVNATSLGYFICISDGEKVLMTTAPMSHLHQTVSTLSSVTFKKDFRFLS